MKIVFMGTPDFATASLAALLAAGYEVVGVVCPPDKPAGRGNVLTPPPVKVFAQAQGLRVLQPEKLRNPEFLETLRSLAPDVIVVVAFRMLPREVWALPPRGTFNLHASLLPDYRGAAPINWAVMNGETVSGNTTFLLDAQIDTGAMLLQERVEIPADWTAGDLHDVLMERGANLVVRTVRGLEDGSLIPQPQPEAQGLHPAPKLFRDNTRIDWSLPPEQIRNFVRGLNPFPTAWTTYQDRNLKVFRVAHASLDRTAGPGSLHTEARRLYVCTGQGWLELLELQAEGKKRMDAQAFLNGVEIPEGARLV